MLNEVTIVPEIKGPFLKWFTRHRLFYICALQWEWLKHSYLILQFRSSHELYLFNSAEFFLNRMLPMVLLKAEGGSEEN